MSALVGVFIKKKSVLKVNVINMPSSCGAYGCTNRGNKNGEISFHTLPLEKKASLRKKMASKYQKRGKDS